MSGPRGVGGGGGECSRGGQGVLRVVVGKRGGLVSGHRGWLVFLSGPREVGGVL